MPKFTSPLNIQFTAENQYTFLTPLIFETEKWRVTVAAGCIYNGGSIPRLLQIVECPMSYAMAYASGLHDPLYGSGLLSRRESDLIFYKALLACGMARTKAYAIWQAVRIGGEAYYKNQSTVSYYRDFVLVEIK